MKEQPLVQSPDKAGGLLIITRKRLKRVIFKINLHTKSWIVDLFGLNLHLNTDDRRVLEKVILPYFASQSEFLRILFVGCDWYTKPYGKYFKEKEYWTI